MSVQKTLKINTRAGAEMQNIQRRATKNVNSARYRSQDLAKRSFWIKS